MIELLKKDDGLVYKAIASYFTKGISAIGAFGMTVLIARILGVEASGIYFLGFTVTTTLVVFTRFGLENSLIRYISPLWASGQYQKLFGVVLQGGGILLIAGVVSWIFLYTCADWLGVHFFKEQRLVSVFQVMAFSIIPASAIWIVAGLLKGIRMPAMANLIETGAVPITVCIVLSIIIYFPIYSDLDERGIAAIYTVLCWIVAMFVIYFFIKRIPNIRRPVFVPIKKFGANSLDYLWFAALNFSILWMSTIFLGFFSNIEQVGIYNVSHRTANLISYILIVFNSINAPRFTALYEKNDLDGIQKLLRKTSLLMAITSLPLILFILIFSSQILSVFGDGFSNTSGALIILAIGQYISVITGSSDYLLIMTGNQRTMLYCLVSAVILGIGMNYILVPELGAIGAALSTAVSIVVQKVLALYVVRKKLGIYTLPFMRKVTFY